MKTKFYALFTLLAIVSFGVMGCELVDPAELDNAAVRNAAAQEEATPEAPAEVETAMAPTPVVRGGLEQFLWKPVAESNGRLVVLLPSSLRGQVTGCTISGSFGTEQGSFAGDTHNGYRPHYRFSKAGAGYGANITVKATLQNGETRTWSIPNGAQRTSY